jgi:hypothetical protein
MRVPGVLNQEDKLLGTAAMLDKAHLLRSIHEAHLRNQLIHQYNDRPAMKITAPAMPVTTPAIRAFVY